MARIDKWLWSVRIFKTRTKATDACKSGRVILEDKKVKPSQDIKIGDILTVKKKGFNFVFQVDKLIQKRVGAPIAETCYTDLTAPDELDKYKLWFTASHGKSEFRPKGMGRPSKKDRREIDRLKDPDE